MHGGNIYDEELQRIAAASGEGLLDFSANINPLGMPEGVRRALREAIPRAEAYPDPECRRLRRSLGERYGLPAEDFLCGNGGADLIWRLTYALRPERALLAAPCFSEYEEALRQSGASVRFFQMPESLQVQPELLTEMDSSIDLMFLCSPNNPTGLLIPQELLLLILGKARECGIFLVLDECFLGLTGQEERSLIPYVQEYPNLFILRSFTKLYAMPGVRLGFGVCGDRTILARMRGAGSSWSVNILAEEAGLAALKEEAYVRETVRLVRTERAFLKGNMERLGLSVWDGQANYLLFRAPGDGTLYERLLRRGILIRRCSDYRGLDDTYYRTAVRGREENTRLLRALSEALMAGTERG